MDFWDQVVRNNVVGTVLGAVIANSGGPPAPVAQPAQEPTPAAVIRAERAADDWIKVADLPIEPGVYKSYDLQSRQICHLVVYPANKGETRMEYGIHCGVDSTPKAER